VSGVSSSSSASASNAPGLLRLRTMQRKSCAKGVRAAPGGVTCAAAFGGGACSFFRFCSVTTSGVA
jgi:hypothetical protein